MNSDPRWQIPPETSRKYWQERLRVFVTLYQQAIPEGSTDEHRWNEAVKFADVLGVATTNDAAKEAIESDPKGATMFLGFALMLDGHYDKYPEQFGHLNVSKKGDRVPPFLYLARSVQATMQQWLERHGSPPSK